MEELKETYIEIRLGDIAYFQKGFAFKSKDFEEVGRKIVKVSNLTDQSIDINSCVCLAEKLAEKYEKYSLNLDDIIITTVGSWPTNPASVVGKVIKVPKIAETALLNQNAVRIRANEKITQKYLYYALKYEKFKNYIINTAQGSASQASITQEDIKNYLINLPPIETQEKIATILSALDDKIEINNEMNKTLEEMAQTLFKRWFIDFDFPNENGEPYRSSGGKMVDSELGEIPEEWEVKKLGEVIDVVDYVANGSFKSLKENVTLYDDPNEILYVRTTDYNNEFSKNLKYTDKKSYNFLKKSKLYGEEVIISNVGDVGTVFRPPSWLGLPMTLGSNAVALTFKEYSYYIYYYFKSRNGQHSIESITTGSAQLKFNKTSLRGLNILIPKQEMLKEFKTIENIIFNKINIIKGEIKLLTEIRDTLLPKLMSGEVEV